MHNGCTPRGHKSSVTALCVCITCRQCFRYHIRRFPRDGLSKPRDGMSSHLYLREFEKHFTVYNVELISLRHMAQTSNSYSEVRTRLFPLYARRPVLYTCSCRSSDPFMLSSLFSSLKFCAVSATAPAPAPPALECRLWAYSVSS